MKRKRRFNTLKFFYDHRGSVSIFLLAVTVSMLIISFLAMDFGKIHLAKASARNNTELAANSVLTMYDKVLKDAYGLFANSTSEADLAKNVADYYLSTMASSGITPENSSETYALISNMILSAMHADMDIPDENGNWLVLRPEAIKGADGTVKNENGIDIRPVKASAISNPAIMRRQIVEYMKFRAPVNLAMGFLEKINVFKDLGNQAEAMNKRLEYEDSLNNVQESSDATYFTLDSYLSNIHNVTGKNYEGEKEVKYSNSDLSTKIVTSGIIPATIASGGGGSTPLDVLHFKTGDFIKRSEMLAPFRNIVKQTKDDKLTLKNKKEITAFIPEDYDATMREFVNLCDLAHTDTERKTYLTLETLYNESSHNNSLIFSVSDSAAAPRYNNDIYKMFSEISEVYEGGSAVPNEGADLGHFYTSFMKLYYTFKYAFETGACPENTEAYENYTDHKVQIEKIYDVLIWGMGRPEVKIMPPESFSYESISSGTNGCLESTVDALYSSAKHAYEDYKSCSLEIIGTSFYQKIASEVMADPKGPLAALRDDIKKAVEDGKNWNHAISDVKTDTYRASMENTLGVETMVLTQAVTSIDNSDNSGKTAEELEADRDKKLQQIIDSLNGLIAKMQVQSKAYGDEYDQLMAKYGGFEINGNVFNVYEGKDTIGFDLINRKTTFDNLYPEYSSIFWMWGGADKSVSFQEKVDSYGFTEHDKISLDLVHEDFYDKIHEEHSDVLGLLYQITEKNLIEENSASKAKQEADKDNSSKDKSAVEEKKKELEEEKNKVVGSGKEDSEDKDDEKEKSTNDMKDVYEDVKKFSEYIKGVDVNEDLPTEAGMKFNVDNMEKSEDGKSKYDVSGMQNLLTQITEMFSNIAEMGRDNLYVTEYLTSAFSCLTTAVTNGVEDKNGAENIAGMMLNKDNCSHYHAELEYIIYGCKTEVGNQAAAIASISGIRLVLNFIYSFTDSEITAFTDTTAAALTALFPFALPVVKVVLHVLLSAAETAWDILQLTKGNSVPIYKSPTTWVCKASNIIGNVASEAFTTAANVAMDKLSEAASEAIEEGGEKLSTWVNDMATQKIDELVSQVNSYVVTPIKEFTTFATARALDEKSKFEAEFSNKFDQIIDSIDANAAGSEETGTSDNILNDILKEVKEYLKSNKDDICNKMFGAVNDALDNGMSSFQSSVNDKLDGLTKKIRETAESFRDKITETINDAASDLGDKVAKGINDTGDKIVSSINSKISEKLSGTRNINISLGSNDGKSKLPDGKKPLNNLLSMTYKDYLYLFLYLGLIGGGDDKLERAAQLMEANLDKQGKEYSINTAVTMFNIDSKSKVKTSMIGRVADSNGVTINNFADGYYTINVSSFAGY